MAPKLLSFVGGKANKEEVLEQGKLGDVEIIIYKRGIVHIQDPKNPDLLFKKDPEEFETALSGLKTKDLEDGQELIIPGCGDNDDLVFACKGDELKMSLRSRDPGVITKLRGFISKAKNAKTKSETKK